MTRAEKAERIHATLDELYPEVPIPLDHSDPFTLLVAVLLSAQTTDARVNLVTPALFKQGPIRLLRVTFLCVGLFHIYRVIFTWYEPPLDDFMKATSIHAIGLLISQFMVPFITFMVIWISTDSLERELIEIIHTDPLTRVKNRRALEKFCTDIFSKAMRDKKLFSLVICDIDHFKSFNDHYGHQMGDQVLIAFANLLSQNTRSVDLVARYGGEEFVVVLPETNLRQAEAIAEDLRRQIMKHHIPHPVTGQPLSITSSFGIASFQPSHTNWSAVLKAADKALYQAKERGRNCVVTA